MSATTENQAGQAGPAGQAGHADPVLVGDLTTVLVKTLRALGQAGQPDQALPLAATAWSRLRAAHPEQAERINGTMHYLARRPDSAPVTGHPAPPQGADGKG
ncbi:hypothetical protein [Ruania albidiflava]|uniref:hypothetical protein n=1 Tax=Ruania albidiflava TaxID=366586 RepID=UPI00058BACEA|nr:hypothetical protein [Ruania albidiflava]